MNNRQANNGRRRGRGGQRSQGGNPGQGGGNRIDNRARGNAAQLLEKYKNLARDAQMQGDRVNTEYYLQFADHYFRVLAESRSRYEEQNPGQQAQQGRRHNTDIDGDDDDFDNDGNDNARGADSGDDGRGRGDEDRQPRGNRRDRGDAREGRRDRGDRQMARDEDGDTAPTAANEDEAPRRRGRPRRDTAQGEGSGDIAAVLPPALGVEGEVVAEAKPRRRRVKKDDGEQAAAE